MSFFFKRKQRKNCKSLKKRYKVVVLGNERAGKSALVSSLSLPKDHYSSRKKEHLSKYKMTIGFDKLYSKMKQETRFERTEYWDVGGVTERGYLQFYLRDAHCIIITVSAIQGFSGKKVRPNENWEKRANYWVDYAREIISEISGNSDSSTNIPIILAATKSDLLLEVDLVALSKMCHSVFKKKDIAVFQITSAKEDQKIDFLRSNIEYFVRQTQKRRDGGHEESSEKKVVTCGSKKNTIH